MHLKLLLCGNAFLMIQSLAGCDSVTCPQRWFHKPAVMFLLSESMVLEREGSPGGWNSPCLLNGSEMRKHMYSGDLLPFCPYQTRVAPSEWDPAPMPEKSSREHEDYGSRVVGICLQHKPASYSHRPHWCDRQQLQTRAKF